MLLKGFSLLVLMLVSAFFSSAETGMMSVNRYRLRHLARLKKHKAARRVKKQLEKPDKLLSVILIGNTFANILASSLATVIAVHYWGEWGVVVSTIFLTLAILIFSEVMPKTIAAVFPEKVAFFASFPLHLLSVLFSPFVAGVNGISKVLLRRLNIRVEGKNDSLTSEELKSIVNEGLDQAVGPHQNMLLGVLELVEMTVNDIMIPKHDVVGIDLEDHWEEILNKLKHTQHTRLPVYKKELNQIEGMIHMRDIVHLMAQENLTRETLLKACEKPLFVPEKTMLSQQLFAFQDERRRTALVVDEYGVVQGLMTLEDILEEIVGEFTSDFSEIAQATLKQPDGSYLVDARVPLRKLNRLMGWSFPLTGAKTLSGLIIEYLQLIPKPKTSLRIGSYQIEIIKVQDNLIKTVRMTCLPENEVC